MLGNYFLDAIPRLHLERAHPLMQDIQGSRFPLNQSDILTDPRFESRMSQYLIRLRFVQNLAADLVEHQAQLLDLIRSAAEK